jgi:hypothetical protein
MLPLEGFTQTTKNKFNFRCPVCGDSKISSKKKRGNAQIWNGQLYVKCFNCNYSKPFSYFIKTEFPLYYKDYIRDTLKSKNKPLISPNFNKSNTVVQRSYQTVNLPKISELSPRHDAYQYLLDRKIPRKFFDKLYYTDNYKKWVNTITPDKYKTIHNKDRRIVIPFYNKVKKLIGFQGRALDDQPVKYLSLKLLRDQDIIYGLDAVDITKTIYVVEGPFDSMFLDNAIATCTSLSKLEVIKNIAPIKQFVLIFDNEKRNTQTIAFMERALNEGFKIVVWDKHLEYKDINEMIKKDLTIKEIYDMIHDNTYSGMRGLIKLKLWKR